MFSMRIPRIPEERFADVGDFPYEPKYAEISDLDGGTLRMAHVDEGNGPVVPLLHGEPSWSYLYRHVMKVLLDAGLRVAAAHLGFGESS
jgi:haloalkane dehalogenase